MMAEHITPTERFKKKATISPPTSRPHSFTLRECYHARCSEEMFTGSGCLMGSPKKGCRNWWRLIVATCSASKAAPLIPEWIFWRASEKRFAALGRTYWNEGLPSLLTRPLLRSSVTRPPELYEIDYPWTHHLPFDRSAAGGILSWLLPPGLSYS